MTQLQCRSVALAISGTIALLGVTCGADDATGDTAARSTTAPSTDAVVVTTDAGVAAPMTIEALCDPLDDTVRGIVGFDVGTDHFDLFAENAETPHLKCEWSESPDVLEARVVYWPSPDVWQSSVAQGGRTIDGVEAEHLYDSGSLSIHASTGWTIDVFVFRGGPLAVDDPDAVAAIGTAALEAAT